MLQCLLMVWYSPPMHSLGICLPHRLFCTSLSLSCSLAMLPSLTSHPPGIPPTALARYPGVRHHSQAAKKKKLLRGSVRSKSLQPPYPINTSTTTAAGQLIGIWISE